MCELMCFIWGFDSNSYVIPTPENYEKLPKKILCPHCGNTPKPIYMKESKVFKFCFVSLCSCGSSEPYMACSICLKKVGNLRKPPCASCNVATPFESVFCPNCGKDLNLNSTNK